MVQVSVVIPARNDAEGLPGAVSSVLAQVDVEVVEVLLCVGPSDDGTEAEAVRLAQSFEVVQFVPNPSGGISAALNLGLHHASARVLVRVDARCRLPVDYVARALATMAATGAANVGAVQVPVGRTKTQRSIARAMRHVLGSGGAAYRSGDGRRQVDTAFLGVFDTSALRLIGGWDDDFARNEDAELNCRLNASGSPVWLDPELRVDYEPRRTLRGLARQYFDYGWWRRRMLARHRRVQLRQLASPLVVLGVSGAVVLATLLSPWFLIVPGAYVLVVVTVAAVSGRSVPFIERLLMAGALFTMHFAWGAGFLASLARGPLTLGPYRPPTQTGGRSDLDEEGREI